ncbi:alpha/beta hydrolase family protein [Aquimarina sp. RZ0]|uniref:alpha/beta hydrolase n=1 Tax=Aquimarina sp. RZ0 TaxID=2607730 RepID=UPI0011F193F3|nr:alpha/beta hydrolase-fold protein [Aquimarina sp. RZ0]KAA1243511.1 prolyl oligopeptidase family serine peptidase [Aquimarina sp. RZ0]
MSKFRTTEISDPRFEANNLRHITVKSKNLQGRGDITVYIPSGAEHKDLPITILLHGVYGSHWIWSQKTGIHLKMQEWITKDEIAPMIIAMPSDGLWGDGSAYVPHTTQDFEKWITEDVINAVIELIPQASENSKICIAGLSMGGFGALRIGSKHNDLFSAVSGLSSITVLDEMKLFVEEKRSLYDQDNTENESVYDTILKNKENIPPFRFDCGVDDELIEGNRKLHQQLEKLNIKHIYKENPGKHEWVYWETHIKETLLFFNDVLNSKGIIV